LLVSGRWLLVTGYLMLDVGCWKICGAGRKAKDARQCKRKEEFKTLGVENLRMRYNPFRFLLCATPLEPWAF
jgi:hypothetical protein